MFRVKILLMCVFLFICSACAGDKSDAPQDGARYMLVSRLNGFCVDVPASSMEEGRQLILWTINNMKNPSPNQVWRLQAAGETGGYKIISAQTEMCLSVEGDSRRDGARIVQLPSAENADSQIWVFTKNGKQYSMRSNSSSKMLTATGYGVDRGAGLVQFEPIDNADHQAFTLMRVR
ncbi:MAG: RICIN domain-containing protein [Spirochaetota bacterium]|jgi:hypothetical protein|nr:RICIN domain-containing protein [Spirochaetota bacterium]